jgi:hypothetical protein
MRYARSFKMKLFALSHILGPKGRSRSKATHSPHLDQAPPSLDVRQQPLILKSMQNDTPPVRSHVDTGIYHIGSLQELPHTM